MKGSKTRFKRAAITSSLLLMAMNSAIAFSYSLDEVSCDVTAFAQGNEATDSGLRSSASASGTFWTYDGGQWWEIPCAAEASSNLDLYSNGGGFGLYGDGWIGSGVSSNWYDPRWGGFTVRATIDLVVAFTVQQETALRFDYDIFNTDQSYWFYDCTLTDIGTNAVEYFFPEDLPKQSVLLSGHSYRFRFAGITEGGFASHEFRRFSLELGTPPVLPEPVTMGLATISLAFAVRRRLTSRNLAVD